MKTHATGKLMLAYLGIICCPIATAAGQTFLVGGSLFSDCADPLGSGVAGITVTISCDGGFSDSTTSFGGQGLYGIANVPEDTCTVTAIGFCYISGSTCPPDPCNDAVSITVNAANQGPNQSLAFWKGVVPCPNDACDAGEDSCTCPQDCGTVCGDGCCNGGEDIASCRADCDPNCTGAPYLIGGAIFSDCEDPLGSGVADMAVHVSCDGGFTCDTTSAGGQGLWSCDGVPCDTCAITVSGACSVGGTCPPDSCSSSVVISANDSNIPDNQSLTFWVPDPCGNGACDADENSCSCPQDCGPCDDGNLCTDDSCDPATAECIHTPIDCGDGDPCTVDSCDPDTGACVNTPINCDDGDPCTDDSCDPDTGACVNTPIDCDDGILCTDDSCDEATGDCVSTPIDCGDGDPCTDDSCDPAIGCVSTPVDCDDGDLCTDDSCDPDTGDCINTLIDCDDGNLCTDDFCDPATGVCVNGQPVCPDGDPCTVDSCDPNTGECIHPPVNCDPDHVCVEGECRWRCDGDDGTSCEDGFFCTTNDTCIQGGCVPGPLDPDCVGTDCWDLDGDGIDDPEEDTNGDGVFDAFDCQGPPGANGANGGTGPTGATGADGTDGTDGTDGETGATGASGTNGTDGTDGEDGTDGAAGQPGLSCWDLNGNGIADPDEDTNGDGNFDAFDCRSQEFEVSVNRANPDGRVVPIDTLQVSVGGVLLVPVPPAPEEGSEFLEWQGDVPAERRFDDPLLLTMDSDKNITAVFQTIPDPTCPGACGSGCGCTPGASAMLLIFIGLLGMRFIGTSRPRRRDD